MKTDIYDYVLVACNCATNHKWAVLVDCNPLDTPDLIFCFTLRGKYFHFIGKWQAVNAFTAFYRYAIISEWGSERELLS